MQPILSKIGKMTLTLMFQNGKEYFSFNSKIFNGNIVAILCANMIKIGPVTPEIARVTTAPFWTRWQKSAYPIEYLSNYQTILVSLSA